MRGKQIINSITEGHLLDTSQKQCLPPKALPAATGSRRADADARSRPPRGLPLRLCSYSIAAITPHTQPRRCVSSGDSHTLHGGGEGRGHTCL